MCRLQAACSCGPAAAAVHSDGTRALSAPGYYGLREHEVHGVPRLLVTTLVGRCFGVLMQPQEGLQLGHAVTQRLLSSSAAAAARHDGLRRRRRARALLGRRSGGLPAPHGHRLARAAAAASAHGGREVELGLGPADLARRSVVGARGVLRGGVGAEPDARALPRVTDLRRPAAPGTAPDPAVRRLAARRRQPGRRRQLQMVLA